MWWTACKRGGVIDGVTTQIEHYMDLVSARQQLVISNLANIDTPGYKSRDIDFQGELQNSMQAQQVSFSLGPRAIPSGPAPQVIETPDLVVKSDGNDVSLDRETRLLAENALRFSVAASLMKGQLKTIESAIKEGPA